MTNPSRESRLLARLAKLQKRRDYHAWRLGDVDAQYAKAVRELAAERGVVFIRVETVRQEIAAREAVRIEKRGEA